MIEDFFTIEFTNYRQGGYVNGISSRSEIGSFKGHIQQPSAELIENLGLSFTNSFILWCDVNVDLKAGDDLVDENNNSYSIRSVNIRNYGGDNKHLEVYIERNEDYASV